MSAIRTFHMFLFQDAVVFANVTENLILPKVKKKLPKVLSVQEVDMLLDYLEQGADIVSIRNRAMIELLYATGMRVTELINLNVDNFL